MNIYNDDVCIYSQTIHTYKANLYSIYIDVYLLEKRVRRVHFTKFT
jgi:hypothetical protein